MQNFLAFRDSPIIPLRRLSRSDKHFLGKEPNHQFYFSFSPQVEFHRLLPFLHDDLPHSVRRMDRAALGLHESGGQSGATFFATANLINDN